MLSHEGHDHPATKAARAACRRAAEKGLDASVARHPASRKGGNAKTPQGRAEGRAKLRPGAEKVTQILTQPHDFVGHETRPSICKHCGQTERGRLHDGVVGESRLHVAQSVCKHPADQWILKGATKKKTGSYYCKCGKFMGDEGPRDLSNLINGAIFGRGRR
jgi:hypothetical protein